MVELQTEGTKCEKQKKEKKLLKAKRKEQNVIEESPEIQSDEACPATESAKKKKSKKKEKRKPIDTEETMEGSVKKMKMTEQDLESPEKKRKKKKNKNKNKAKEEEDNVLSPDAQSNKAKKKVRAEDEKELHTGIFRKSFFKPSPETLAMSTGAVTSYLNENCITLEGDGHEDVKPVTAFNLLTGLPEMALDACRGFERPTPIQALCWPVIASGRDVIGTAETGSGKTLAFSVPALAHLAHRKRNAVLPKEIPSSPMMLVLAPTRELAMQSAEVLENAGRNCGITSTCIYGGVPKSEQRQALRRGVDAVVATPGRLIDLMEEGLADLRGVSYLVLDEADRMLDQGFERAIRTIVEQTHKERQTCLFSATWPNAIRDLAHEFLTCPIRVTVGSDDLAAGRNVTQIVEVVEERSRDGRLQKLLGKYQGKGVKRTLIFVLYKKEADRVLNNLHRSGWNNLAACIHGDKTQEARTKAVADFKSGRVPILVATDVAARGLDIPDVSFVINYSFPLTIEDYVHRIGRTGRAGKTGVAHTFFHSGDKLRAGELVKVLKESNQKVPEELMTRFDLSIKRKEHKLYGAFGPKDYGQPMKKATKIKFD